MKQLLLLTLAVLAFSCGRDSDTIIGPKPQPPEGYPFVLKYSDERFQEFRFQWGRFAQAYNLPPGLPAFDSALMMPDLPPVDLLPATTDTVTLRQAHDLLLLFMERWRHFFHTEGPLYLLGENTSPGSYSFIFSRYSGYVFTRFNRVQARITHGGLLQAFRSTCLPQAPVPPAVRYSLAEALRIVDGTKLYFYDWGGRDSLVVTPDVITEALLQVTYIPTYSPGSSHYLAVEYRYCWRLKAPVFYLYVDAVTGEFLDYSEQYVIF